MPRAFNDQEKQIIRDELLRNAKKLFLSFGLKKTTLDEIVGLAGISKGAFYLFFNSKEELFFEILESMEKEMRNGFDLNKISSFISKKDFFMAYLKYCLDFVDKSAIFSLISNENFAYLVRKLPQDKIKAHIKNDDNYFIEFYSFLKQNVKLREVSEEAVRGILKSMFFLYIHKDDIGSEIFDKTIDLYISMIAEYLILEE